MAQYLLAMLTQRAGREGLADPFSGFSFLGGPEDGRMGDYVFNQEGMWIWVIIARVELTQYSAGPHHHSDHGAREFFPPSPSYRRRHGTTSPRSVRGRMWVGIELFIADVLNLNSVSFASGWRMRSV
jgi:hypothetical protein